MSSISFKIYQVIDWQINVIYFQMRSFLLKISYFLMFMLFAQVTLIGQKFTVFNGDTINRIDENNQKQGLWLTFDASGKTVIERGIFLNNKKDGLWVSYFPGGQVKQEITFKGGVANGDAKFYYENGRVWEQGNWMIDHWVGKYQFYYPSGQVAYDWNYNNLGKRSGEQRYYHENGNVKYLGKWENGKTAGALKIYNEMGQLTAERIYAEGKFEQTINHITVSSDKDNAIKSEIFTGSGFNTIYNMSGQIEKKGLFDNGQLVEGEQNIYDSNGKLSTVLIFKGGEVKETKIIK